MFSRFTLALCLGALAMSIAACTVPARAPSRDQPLTRSAPVEPATTATTPASRPDPWWGDRHAAILANVRAGGHETAFIGDSITQGWETEGKDVWRERFQSLKPVNCGIGGDRTQHILYRLDDGLLDALAAPNNHIQRIVLLIGTNNTSPPADSAHDIAGGVRAIIARLDSKLPNAHIILMAVFPRGQWHNPQREKIVSINAELEELARQNPAHFTFVDLRQKYLRDSGELPASLMPDFLHLSPESYQIWADAVLEAARPR